MGIEQQQQNYNPWQRNKHVMRGLAFDPGRSGRMRGLRTGLLGTAGAGPLGTVDRPAPERRPHPVFL